MSNSTKVSLEHLMQLPLLQGMSRSEILRIAGIVALNFSKWSQGRRIVDAGEHCRSLLFVLDGRVVAETHDRERNYFLREWLSAPFILQPEALFGLHTRYTSTFIAADESPTSLLEIDKAAIREVLFTIPTFQMNYLNTLCLSAQQKTVEAWESRPVSLHDRIVCFIRTRCCSLAGRKELHINMEHLAHELGTTRLNISRALHRLSETDALTIGRSCITIPDFKQLEARATALSDSKQLRKNS